MAEKNTIKEIRTTCCYCGTGCQLLFTADQETNKILGVHPAWGKTNEGTACLKGWYGWDYLNDPQILTRRKFHETGAINTTYAEFLEKPNSHS
jgi:formate dehydrogenase major subunit